MFDTVSYSRVTPPWSENFDGSPHLYVSKEVSTCSFSIVNDSLYVQGSIQISVLMVLLIKSTSTQQDKAEQLDGTTHDTDGGGFKIKSLSAHSINKI